MRKLSTFYQQADVDKLVDSTFQRSIIIKHTEIQIFCGLARPLSYRKRRVNLIKNRLIIRKRLKVGSKSDKSTKSQSIRFLFSSIYSRWTGFFVLLFIFCVVPAITNASFFSNIANFFTGNIQKVQTTVSQANSQNVPLLTSTASFDANAAVGGGDITVADNDEALVSESGPSGTFADIGNTVNTGQISKYTVRKGDNLASIAKMYGVSKNTIIWANDLSSGSVKEGQSLIILPVSGTIHTVVKGDTLKSIAKKYKADAGEIAQFNNLDSSSSLAIGDTIIIPDGEGAAKISGATRPSNGTSPYLGDGGPAYPGYYIRPLTGGVKTQGLHGYNAIDIGTSVGTTLYAAAAGQVIIAREGGWNGGYGSYVVISHYNGTQTVYGHMSQVNVNPGDLVYQGQIIGLSGNTGHSTGPHLHFEVRGAYNFMNDRAEY